MDSALGYEPRFCGGSSPSRGTTVRICHRDLHYNEICTCSSIGLEHVTTNQEILRVRVPSGVLNGFVMKTRILKKINKRIRIVETEDNMFEVQIRHPFKTKELRDKEWHVINIFSTYKKAVERRNNHISMIIMRDLGLRNEFVKRRTKRKKRKGLV